MTPQTGFWFVRASRGTESVSLAVAAFTARSARVQARKRLGPTFTINEIHPVQYPHAWAIDFGWWQGRTQAEAVKGSR